MEWIVRPIERSLVHRGSATRSSLQSQLHLRPAAASLSNNIRTSHNNSRDTDQKEEEESSPQCELNRIKFENSICKVLPDTADFPEDIFNVEGCVWCGSQGHEVLDCLGYTSWLNRFYLLDKAITIEEWVRREQIIKTKARNHYNPNKPWELYIGRADCEYLTDKGVKILVKDEKIVNLVPRHLQTTTTVYADFPTPDEVCEMLRLSPMTKSIARTTLMDELCNQAISFKEDMEQLEMELKTSMSQQLKKLKKNLEQEMQKFYTALMDDRIAQLPKQFDQMREYLSKTVFNLHKRSLKSDITTVRIFRELFESKTPDSNMVWKREICKGDPTYQFRGRWRQMADRLNTVADYTIKANLIVPIMDSKHADDLRTVADLLIEVMYQMFYQAGILQSDDLLDMEDFSIFQEAVCRTMQLQSISVNQICNFIQQIIYYNQCQCLKKRELAYLDYRNEMDTYLGILLQTTLKNWNQPGNCKCDFIEKLKCNHSTTYSILHQHFPNHKKSSIASMMELLDTISTQTCDCSYHAKLPMHGPSKYIKEPIPTYEQLQQLHKEQDPTLMKSDLQALYVQAITS